MPRPFARSVAEVYTTTRSHITNGATAPSSYPTASCGQTRIHQPARVTVIVLVCPACGADRVIPLTFPMHQREAGPEVVFMRPMAKCSGCGERIFAKVIARQRLPKPI
jgi:hypothetical protein